MKAGMKAESVLAGDSPEIGTYKNLMSNIEFMQKYVEDIDIFTPDSAKFKNFLIHSFCYLHPDFHYLSFLNKEDVDMEIIKVASILQILPSNSMKRQARLFDNISKDDIHKFWLKFFALFKKEDDFSTETIFNLNWESKINFFNDLESTTNYLKYEFPVINSKRLIKIDVNKEVESWEQQAAENAFNESTCLNYDEKQITDVDIEKLMIDLEQMALLCNNIKPNYQLINSDYVDFFISFINLSKNILQCRKNLNIIDTTLLEEFICKLLSNDENLLENFYFIKRCNNFVKTLKCKIKALQ